MKQVKQTKVTRHIFSTFITNIIQGGGGFLLAIIYARTLGPEGKGYITAIILWATILASLFSFGFSSANVYQAAKNRFLASKLTTNSFFMLFTLSPLALLIGWVGLPIFFKSSNTALLQASKISLIAVPILMLQAFLFGLLRGWQKIDQFNFLRIFEKAALLFVLLFLILFQNISLTIVTIAWIIMCSLTTFITLLLIYKNRMIKFIWDGKLLVKSIKYGLKSYVGTISELGNLRLDQLIIAALFSASILGIYSVAVTVTESLWLLAYAVSIVIFPTTSTLSKTDALELTAKASRITFTILSILAIIIFFIAPKLIIFLFGIKFTSAILLLKILLPGGIAFGVGRVLSSGLMGINKPLNASTAQVAALLSTIIAAPPLIYFYAAIGAAIASDLAYGIYLIIVLYYFLKSSPLSTKDLLLFKISDFAALKGYFDK